MLTVPNHNNSTTEKATRLPQSSQQSCHAIPCMPGHAKAACHACRAKEHRPPLQPSHRFMQFTVVRIHRKSHASFPTAIAALRCWCRCCRVCCPRLPLLACLARWFVRSPSLLIPFSIFSCTYLCNVGLSPSGRTIRVVMMMMMMAYVVYGMLYSMAWYMAWHGIYGIVYGMVHGMLYVQHGMVYDMTRYMWHCICWSAVGSVVRGCSLLACPACSMVCWGSSRVLLSIYLCNGGPSPSGRTIRVVMMMMAWCSSRSSSG